MSQEKLQHVDNLLKNKPQFSTILANLLFSANNPFQEGFPFVHDTAHKKKFAKRQHKNFQKRGVMARIFNDSEGENSEDEAAGAPKVESNPQVDIYSLVS